MPPSPLESFLGLLALLAGILAALLIVLLLCATVFLSCAGVYMTLAYLLTLVGVRRPESRRAFLAFVTPPAFLAYLMWATATLLRFFDLAPTI